MLDIHSEVLQAEKRIRSSVRETPLPDFRTFWQTKWRQASPLLCS